MSGMTQCESGTKYEYSETAYLFIFKTHTHTHTLSGIKLALNVDYLQQSEMQKKIIDC